MTIGELKLLKKNYLNFDLSHNPSIQKTARDDIKSMKASQKNDP